MNQTTNHIKLGLFVLSGTIVLILALYMIGSKRNVFSNTIEISAVFYNVNGLMPGNNVRYGGIDIGTVKKLVFENDTSITVKMVIEKKIAHFIKKNAVASIGTDGLMGNKLVNINSVMEAAQPIQEGDVLLSMRPVESDEMVRTLNETNLNLNAITNDLKGLTQRINKNNNLISLLSDTTATENLRQAISAINQAADHARNVTQQVDDMVLNIKNGKGIAGTILTDTASAGNFLRMLNNLERFSDSLNTTINRIGTFSSQLNNSNGLLHAAMTDSSMKNDVKSMIQQLNKSAAVLDEDLHALQKNFLFRKYFRQKEKKEKQIQ
jgi:phospholipid/cholesterol/gamma-HCH transport system substrate-binding protein